MQLHDIGELDDRGRVVQVSLLGHVRKCEVVIDQENERFALIGRKLQPGGDLLGKDRARLGVWPRPDRSACVVHEQRQIKHERIFKLLEQFPIGSQLRIFGMSERVQLFDAHQRVFVGRVAMKEFMLHETCQVAEFRNVTPQKIYAVHHAKNPADPAFA